MLLLDEGGAANCIRASNAALLMMVTTVVLLLSFCLGRDGGGGLEPWEKSSRGVCDGCVGRLLLRARFIQKRCLFNSQFCLPLFFGKLLLDCHYN